MSQKHVLEDIRHPEPTLDEEIATLGDDDLMDMANLTSKQTGIDGIVFISTEMGKHGPRVKYFLKAGRNQRSFSVTIGGKPALAASSLDDRTTNKMAPQVIDWVKLNRTELLDFWSNGNDWTVDEVSAFIARLNKLPSVT
jgi:hypothetical protein